MKQIILVLSMLVLLAGCYPEEVTPKKTGSLSFALKEEALSGGRMSSSERPHAVMISLTKADGTAVDTPRTLPLLNLNGSYITESIQLNVGEYLLTEFVVIGAESKVLYVAPKADSELASYVEDPLPLPITVGEASSSQVTPEVLQVEEENTPEDFGYASFSFAAVNVFGCKLILTHNGVVVPGEVTVEGQNSNGDVLWTVTKQMTASRNSVLLKGGLDTYSFHISFEKTIREVTLTEDEIKADPTIEVSLFSDDNFYIYTTKDGNLTLKLPKDPTNPYYEISVLEKNAINYVVVDRVFWKGSDQVSEYLSRTFNSFATSSISDDFTFAVLSGFEGQYGVTWDVADAVLVYDGLNEYEEISHKWDPRP